MGLLTTVCGWTAEEVLVDVARARNDAKNTNIHSYYMMCVVSLPNPFLLLGGLLGLNRHVVFGQRPLEEDRNAG